eukprot:g13889.t1
MGGAAAPAAASIASSSEAEKRKVEVEPNDDDIDPQIQELCDYFNIEDRWVKRLNETMRKRQDTKQEDIEKLYEVLERARSPTGLLTVKIGEMECGRFDVERLARKFRLDEPVASRLTELVHRRKQQGEPDRAQKDLHTIEQHLRYCKRTSAMATLLAGPAPDRHTTARKLLEGDVDELPDLTEAEHVMDRRGMGESAGRGRAPAAGSEKYRLDEDAKSKLREIIEKRAVDAKEVLVQIKKHLDTSVNCSSMLCKIARPLIDHEHLPDPPERTKGKGKGEEKGDRGDRGRTDDRRNDRRLYEIVSNSEPTHSIWRPPPSLDAVHHGSVEQLPFHLHWVKCPPDADAVLAMLGAGLLDVAILHTEDGTALGSNSCGDVVHAVSMGSSLRICGTYTSSLKGFGLYILNQKKDEESETLRSPCGLLHNSLGSQLALPLGDG